MGIFKGINRVKPRVDANYIGPGKYLLRIDKVKVEQTRKREDFFAVEMTVLHVLDDLEGQAAHRVGDGVTWLIKNAGDSADYFLPEISAFVKAVVGEDLASMDDEEAESCVDQMVADDQPLAGMLIEVHARHVATQSGGTFTKVAFKRAVPAAEVAETLTDGEIERFFPNNSLLKLVEAEEQQAAATA